MPHLRLAAASALLLAICQAAPGQAQTPRSRVTKIGPSYTCKPGQEPLAQLICSDPGLSRTDLAFVQAYQSLRAQSDPTGQAALWKEQVAFHDEVLSQCAIPAAGDLPAATPAMTSCVEAAYDRKRAEWFSQLHGPALEEASRPLADHIAAQRTLQTLGFLPADAALDGVYGPATRAALRAFQRSVGQTPTGIMADWDAGALGRAVAARPFSPSTVEDSHLPYGRAHSPSVNGASLAPLSSLADWVGKYPSWFEEYPNDLKGKLYPPGKSFWENGELMPRLIALIGRSRFEDALRNFGTSGPIERRGQWIGVDAMAPHSGGFHGIQLFANLVSGNLRVCWADDSETHEQAHDIWFASGHEPMILGTASSEGVLAATAGCRATSFDEKMREFEAVGDIVDPAARHENSKVAKNAQSDWYIINNQTGECSPSDEGPGGIVAYLQQGGRAHSAEDTRDPESGKIVQSEISTSQPGQPFGTVTAWTFYRGATRCEAAAQARREEVDRYK